jgi:hypothetical protein
MTRKQFSPWRTRLAIVATGFAALGAIHTAKAVAAPPSVSVFNAHTAEGNVGTKPMPFSVKLSMPSPAPQWVQLQPGVGGPTPATANTDFNAAGPYVVNFAPGETAKVVNVPIKGDTLHEYNETFALRVVAHGPGIAVADGEGIGMITNDDAAPIVSVNDVSKAEGTGGLTPFTFTAKLSAPSATTIKVDAVAQSGTALVPEDLTGGPVTLSFGPGVTSRTYSPQINGDGKVEANETFTVNLSHPVNATLGDSVGAGKIVNDDYLVGQPQPQPKPQPQPDPDPNGNGGNDSGGNFGGGNSGTTGGGFAPQSVDGGTSADGIAAPTGDSTTGAGEQALGAAAGPKAHHSIDWTTSALLVLLGLCLAGLVAVGFVIARQRREDNTGNTTA